MKGRQAAMLLATMATLLGIDHELMRDFRNNKVTKVTEPTVPSEDELNWMQGLNSHRRKDWQRRFANGLTKEQREYVDSQVKG